MHALYDPEYVWWHWRETGGWSGMWLWSPQYRSCDARCRVRSLTNPSIAFFFFFFIQSSQYNQFLYLCLIQFVRRFRHWQRRTGDFQEKCGGIWDFQPGSGPVWPVLSGGKGVWEKVWHSNNEPTIWNETQSRWALKRKWLLLLFLQTWGATRRQM